MPRQERYERDEEGFAPAHEGSAPEHEAEEAFPLLEAGVIGEGEGGEEADLQLAEDAIAPLARFCCCCFFFFFFIPFFRGHAARGFSPRLVVFDHAGEFPAAVKVAFCPLAADGAGGPGPAKVDVEERELFFGAVEGGGLGAGKAGDVVAVAGRGGGCGEGVDEG